MKLKSSRGFTLIEMMVSFAIITLITAVVMFNYTSFNNSILLKSQAYELALDIRNAQVSGVSVAGSGTSFRSAAYGVYVAKATPNSYIFFQDSNTNKMYDAGTDQIVATYTIDSRFVLSKICNSDTDTVCAGGVGSVVFVRPDFDAKIANDIGSGYSVKTANSIKFVLASATDPTQFKSVIVYNSGQISVK